MYLLFEIAAILEPHNIRALCIYFCVTSDHGTSERRTLVLIMEMIKLLTAYLSLPPKKMIPTKGSDLMIENCQPFLQAFEEMES